MACKFDIVNGIYITILVYFIHEYGHQRVSQQGTKYAQKPAVQCHRYFSLPESGMSTKPLHARTHRALDLVTDAMVKPLRQSVK